MSNASASPHIVEATPENFIAEVVERSRDVPVVVDFWAEWCQPCRILGPILEKLASEFEGKFILVKAETEKLQEVASSFGVRSIPAVFAVKGGQVVDSFVGVLPEASIRAWLDRIMPTPTETLRDEAHKVEKADPSAAEGLYREALALDPTDSLAKIGLARVVLALGRTVESRQILEELERRGYLEPEAEILKAELTLHPSPVAVGDLAALKAAHEAEPLDKSGQLRFAEALASAGDYEAALPLALDLVERDRRQTGETARKLMIAAFQLLPPDSELANDYRRRLSVAL